MTLETALQIWLCVFVLAVVGAAILALFDN